MNRWTLFAAGFALAAVLFGGSTHTVSENASDTVSASLLAIFVADDGAQLTRGAADK